MTTETRTRKQNPLTAYEKAKTLADRARKAAVKAVELEEKHRAALEKANSLIAVKDEAEAAEQTALTTLQAHLDSLTIDGIEEVDEDE